MRPPYDLGKRQVALTCGFHDSCKRYPHRSQPYLRGYGLDWNDNNGTWPETKSVYFTASAHASKPNTRVGTVTFEYHRPGRDPGYPCATLVAIVWSYPKPVELFRIMYQHTAPVRGLGPLRLYSSSATSDIERSRPNVVTRIGVMVDDPCAYFTRTPEGVPLYHTHVEPQSRARAVAFRVNTGVNEAGGRVLPDVNGCGRACSGPVYPGPRFRAPYWSLWTFHWRWAADPRTGAVSRAR